MTEQIRRSIDTIAAEITHLWKNPYFAAVPYLSAMRQLDAITDTYMCESGKSIVLYFLSNATRWQGPDARRIKAELKSLVGAK